MTKQDLSCVNNFFSWPVDVWGFVTEFSLILCVFGMVHRIKVKGTEEYGLWREGGSLNLPVMGPIHLWFGFSGKTQMALPHRAVADTGRALSTSTWRGTGAQPMSGLRTHKRFGQIRPCDSFQLRGYLIPTCFYHILAVFIFSPTPCLPFWNSNFL